MQRTESKVVTVMPHQENAKIKEMEMFGWNLRGRQDVVTPIYADSDATPKLFGNGYNIDTSIESAHYVKLHFVRSLDLPNLDETKKLESKYPFGELPKVSEVGFLPAILIGIGIVSLICGITGLITGNGGPIAIIIGLILLAVSWAWARSNAKSNEKIKKRRQEILRRRQEVIK